MNLVNSHGFAFVSRTLFYFGAKCSDTEVERASERNIYINLEVLLALRFLVLNFMRSSSSPASPLAVLLLCLAVYRTETFMALR
jgi:hypothetical protein